MKPLSSKSSVTTALILTLGLQMEFALASSQQQQLVQNRLIDKCCQVGRERAIESSKFNCKLSAREALIQPHASHNQQRSISLLSLSAESVLSKDPSFADQCEMVLESCCMAHHRTKNCDSGKQFAKIGSTCMDVELSKEASVATESFNDCCMSCSLGILAARTSHPNETSNPTTASLSARCRLMSPLSSLSGQLYEQTYIECCQENLPKISGALIEPGTPIDCIQTNPCSQRCVAAGTFLDSTNRRRADRDRCECFAGYRLASDGVSCLDIDECKLGTHSCNRQNEICDNVKGSFRCLARYESSASVSVNENDDLSLANSDTVEFNSSRLCPLGSRWSAADGRCLHQADNKDQRSASLIASPLSSHHQTTNSRFRATDWN